MDRFWVCERTDFPRFDRPKLFTRRIVMDTPIRGSLNLNGCKSHGYKPSWTVYPNRHPRGFRRHRFPERVVGAKPHRVRSFPRTANDLSKSKPTSVARPPEWSALLHKCRFRGRQCVSLEWLHSPADSALSVPLRQSICCRILSLHSCRILFLQSGVGSTCVLFLLRRLDSRVQI